MNDDLYTNVTEFIKEIEPLIPAVTYKDFIRSMTELTIKQVKDKIKKLAAKYLKSHPVASPQSNNEPPFKNAIAHYMKEKSYSIEV